MTERKTFKRRVRARMEKTGERYTAARRHVADAAEEPLPEGPSDERVAAATGHGLRHWLGVLDEWGAESRTHTEIARHLRDDHGVSGWWAQSITVSYERACGLRAKHQTGETFTVSVSKTVAVPVERLHAAFADEQERARWLPAGELSLRTARPPRSARFDHGDGVTRVHAHLDAKGPERSVVSLQHERLRTLEEAEAAKAAWRERLARLKQVLEE